MHRYTVFVALLVALLSAKTQQAPAGGMDAMEQVKELLMKQHEKEEAERMKEEAEEKKEEACKEDYTSEENNWRWEPPSPCRFVNTSGAVVGNYPCVMGFQCSIGPLRVTVNGTTGDAYFCAYYTAPVLLYHACEVVDLESGTPVKAAPCASDYGKCTLGPVMIDAGDRRLEALYCDLAPQTWLRKRTILDRACRVADESHYIRHQRYCPDGFGCTSEAEHVEFPDGSKGYAFTCMPSEMDHGGHGGDMPLPENMSLQHILGALIYDIVDRWATGAEPSDMEKQLTEKLLKHMMENGGELEGENEEERYLVFVYKRLLLAEHNYEEDHEHGMAVITGLFHELAGENGRKYALMHILKGIVEHAHNTKSQAADQLHEMVAKVLHGLLGNMEEHKDEHEALKKLLMMALSGGHNQEGMGGMLQMMLQMLMERHSGGDENGGEDANELMKMMMKWMMDGDKGGKGGMKDDMDDEDDDMGNMGGDDTDILVMIRTLMMQMKQGRENREHNDMLLHMMYKAIQERMANQGGQGGMGQGGSGQGGSGQGGMDDMPETPEDKIKHLYMVMKQIYSRTEDIKVKAVLGALMSMAEIAMKHPSPNNLPLMAHLLHSVIEEVGPNDDLHMLQNVIMMAMDHRGD
jgi:hypothetical protein